MENTTKFNATNEQICAAFKAAGLGEIKNIIELSDGWFNRIYSAEDMQKNKYVIKFAPPKDAPVLTHERNMMLSEVNCYRLIQEKTQIKTPKIIFSDFSEKIVPTAYFIMDFLKGVRLDKSKLTHEDKQKVAEKLAYILTEFHKIEGSGYGYEQAGLRGNWKEGLSHMTQILIDDCATFNRKCKNGKKLLTYIEKFSSILTDVPCVLVNYDLHSMNMFCEKKENGEVELAVLDLERCFFGDSIGDFVAQDFQKTLLKKNITQYYNRYAKAPIVGDKKEKIRLYLMTAYLSVIMYTERFSRFQSFSKFFNPVYIMGTVGYKFFGIIAFAKLKRLAR